MRHGQCGGELRLTPDDRYVGKEYPEDEDWHVLKGNRTLCGIPGPFVLVQNNLLLSTDQPICADCIAELEPLQG